MVITVSGKNQRIGVGKITHLHSGDGHMVSLLPMRFIIGLQRLMATVPDDA